MHGAEESDARRHLLMNALVTFSDSCTLPLLTPSCPYYRHDGHSASCNEECRDLIDEWGIADRRVREVQIGGLVLRGRGMPIEVATGAVPFDATKNYLRERRFSPPQQSTGSLLLGLGAYVTDPSGLEDHSGDFAGSSYLRWGA